MTVEIDREKMLEGIAGLWGSSDPDESTLAQIRVGVTGEKLMLIDGELVGSSSGATFENINPATGELLGEVADATAEDVERAIGAARRAFDTTEWSSNPELRRRCLLQLHAALEKNVDLIRATTVIETGVAVRTTNTFHSYLPISALPFWADKAVEFEYEEEFGDRPWAAGNKQYLRKEAVGVVAAITPWNFPLQTAATKLFPALAAGCTVILKAAVQTPWIATLLAKLIVQETDFPAGVINIVIPSDNAVAEILATDGRVDLVHFTGSTAVGKKLMAKASDRVARVALELGGKSANIFLPDADFETLIPLGAAVVCMNSGQACELPTRMLVPRDRYEEAIKLAKIGLQSVPWGDPTDPSIIHGPQITEVQRQRILNLIEKGKEEGARLVLGGGIPAGAGNGFYVEPTLFVDVDPNSTLAQQEIFGPVLAMIPYDDVDHAVEIANNSIYGLAGAVWGTDVDAALDVARRIRTGLISVNGGFPHGPDVPSGGFKQSGLGRECGDQGFEEFLETKIMAVAL